MKEVIRQSVFETNSSSSHSVVLKRKKPDEKWRTPQEIAGKNAENLVYSEHKEVRSAFEKMLLVWGIECEEYFYVKPNEYDSDSEVDDEELENQKLAEEQHYIMRNVLIEECKKVEDIDVDFAGVLMDDCTKFGWLHPLCCRFFNEDVLNECSCGLSVMSIARDLGFDKFEDGEPFMHEFAKRLFDENVYFLLCEGYFGGCWEIDKNIF